MSENNFLVPQMKPESLLPKKLPCPFSPSGMLQPSHLQPPPMFGPRGPTIPPKHMPTYAHFKINRPRHNRVPYNKEHNQQNRWNGSNPRPQNKFQNNHRHQSPQQYQRSREFWCEPCDRDFRTQELLTEHKSQHQKCGIDGCKFEGHELIVTKHIQMQHSTGLFERLKNLETPEDISKWREERKKRYPSKANIELRQQIQVERNKRGEKLTDSKARFGRNSDRRSCTNQRRDDNRKEDVKKDGKKKRRRTNKKNIVNVERTEGGCNDKNDDGKDDSSDSALPRFEGTSLLKDYKKRKAVQPTNLLTNLLGMYGSDSDSSDDSDDAKSINKIEDTPLESSTVSSENVPIQECSKEEDCPNNSEHQIVIENEIEDLQNDVEDLPCEEPILKQEAVIAGISETGVPKGVHRKKTKIVDKRISKKATILDLSKKYRNQNTMLEKLLQKDIRHERNVLLQCVRHVVKENFFGIGQKPSSS